jgi:tetratricopeptide (TPR) repeat protein/tRNA A-37 threonylcarbamoyl transferase component Bud32
MSGVSEGTVTAVDATLASSPAARGPSLAPGTIIGRYVVLSKLGAGAMGVVLAAYDPELDRKVALKLIRSRGHDQAARTRLRREAQALARLDHRNVVAVHDVGVHEGQLFVAMEFVAGQTLRAWMQSVDEPRPWREAVRVFMEAGRGLEAAHGAGLVHRDFKPDNVMLGDDGRVRVMDFGLARAEEGGAGDHGVDVVATDEALGGTGKALVGPLTQTGMLLGTPAYMAPEQFTGTPANARSDQFGFCVALHEALYGKRPFAGQSLAQLIDAVSNGPLREAPASSTVPAWLRKVVLRGLAKAPEDRFESMHALLEALAADPAVRRRKWWGVAAVLGLLAGVWGLVRTAEHEAQVCSGMERKLAGVWDDRRRAEVQAAIEATQLSYAPGTWRRVEQQLDAYTRQWVDARTEACEATHRGEQSDDLLDLRMACLDERLLHVRATVDVFARANETAVNKAAEALADLPTLERCADVEALRAEVPPPEDLRMARRVAELEQRLAEAEALELLGQYEDGLTQANAVVSEAEQLGYEPLEARAWLRQGVLLRKSGSYEAAEEALERAYDAALGQRMVDEAASASTDLVLVVGYLAARHEDGRRWAQHSGPLSRAARASEARARHFNNLGVIAEQEGHYEESREYHERALAIFEEALGPRHPRVAISLTNLGNVVDSQGKYEEAREYQERALAIFEEALGPEHPNVATALNNLGDVTLSLGEYEQTREYHERARAIWEKALGPDHPSVAMSLTNLGIVAARQGRLEEAREYQARALAIFEAALGPEHPHVAVSLTNLGDIAKREGRYEEAREYQERALAVFEGALGPEHLTLAYPLTSLGEVLIAQGDPGGALFPLERALSLRTSVGVEPGELAETRIALTRALWDAPAEAGRDRARARKLAESAREAYAKEKSPEGLDEVDAWLSEHVE